MDSRRLPWLAVAASAVLVALHKPWALQNAQLWAEDGNVFLVDADLHGASSLWRPYAGYLNLVPRAIALAARAIADACAWPTMYNAAALVVTVLVLARMASQRFDVPRKPWLILAVPLVAHSGEVFLNITNVQWVTALLLVQQLTMRPPMTALQAAGDIAVIVVAGLTGPFVLLVLPFFAWRAWRDHGRAGWILLLAVAACGLIQAGVLFHQTAGPSAGPFDVRNFVVLAGNRLAVWPLLGPEAVAKMPAAALAAAGVAAAAALAWVVLAARPLRTHEVLVLLLAVVVLGAVAWHARMDAWDARDVSNGDRYYFIPRLLLAWLLVWQFDARRRGVAIAAKALCAIGVIAQLPNYRIPAPPDYHWAAYCDRIRQGIAVSVPTLPEGWKLDYPGRPGDAR